MASPPQLLSHETPIYSLQQQSAKVGELGESNLGFGRALSSRVRRRWFIYLIMSVFYCLDIYLTLLVLGRGYMKESNPISQNVLLVVGPGGWIAFRVVILLVTSAALFTTFTLATNMLTRLGREGDIDRIEEVTVGTVMLFYAIAIVHNLVAIMTPLSRFT